MIRTNDFRAQWEEIGPQARKAFERVGASGWYVLGNEVEAFESELAAVWGLPHAVGVGNGLDALEIALRALDLPPGERVLTTPLSAFATTLAIVRAGGAPVFVDVDERGLLDLDRVEAAVAAPDGPRWLLPVHLYGLTVDLDRLAELAEAHDLVVVEDCAQSIGARWRGRAAGTAGRAAATSFYPTKNLGALGDGGALLTADAALAERARRLRHYGQSATYVHDEPGGSNSRLDELQAALLRSALLPRLEAWTERRRAIAARYLTSIRHPAVGLPAPDARSEPVWHLFPVVVEPERRDAFREHLRSAGVETGIHYPTLIPDQRALAAVAGREVIGDLPRARRFAGGEVSLPIHPHLSDDEVDRVAAAVAAWEVGC